MTFVIGAKTGLTRKYNHSATPSDDQKACPKHVTLAALWFVQEPPSGYNLGKSPFPRDGVVCAILRRFSS